MEKVLLLLHTEAGGGLGKASLEALSAGLALSPAGLMVGLVGGAVQSAADSIASCGAARMLGVEGEAFGVSRYSTDAAAAEAICRSAQPSIVLAPGTPRWSRVLPGVAQRMGGEIDTHVVGVEGEGPSISRWYYRQRIEVTQSRKARPWFLLLDGGVREAWSGAAGEAAVEKIDVALSPELTRTQVIGFQAQASGQQTIRPDADLLFVTGAGWTKKQKDGQIHLPEAERLILDFVGATQCSLGSSKSLVDLSGEGQTVLPFLTHLHQVGQTGSTPRHAKGLATCCHGEEPHVVGWRFINERRAVNLDASCGWARGKADVLYVADAFAVIARVNELLKEG